MLRLSYYEYSAIGLENCEADKGKEIEMKKNFHPAYEDATVTCACGNVIHTRSTVKEMHINTCSGCHPFFTGKAKFIDAEGRVERFRKRYANAAK